MHFGKAVDVLLRRDLLQQLPLDGGRDGQFESLLLQHLDQSLGHRKFSLSVSVSSDPLCPPYTVVSGEDGFRVSEIVCVTFRHTLAFTFKGVSVSLDSVKGLYSKTLLDCRGHVPHWGTLVLGPSSSLTLRR